MGWYLRKSFGIGPLRLNLSKSGLGLSGGVKGLRVGTGPRGSYLHGGREGLYFRKSLRTRRKQGEVEQIPESADVLHESDEASKGEGQGLWSAVWRGIFGGLMRGR